MTFTGVQGDGNLLHLKCINTVIHNNETINTYTLKVTGWGMQHISSNTYIFCFNVGSYWRFLIHFPQEHVKCLV